LDAPRVLLGDTEIPEVLKTLAALLPNCSLEDLDSQLQTFDIFIPILSPRAHPKLVSLLVSAADAAKDPQVRAAILAKANSISA
jgi:hypothetical protein